MLACVCVVVLVGLPRDGSVDVPEVKFYVSMCLAPNFHYGSNNLQIGTITSGEQEYIIQLTRRRRCTRGISLAWIEGIESLEMTV